MPVDRAFLDIFWGFSAKEEEERNNFAEKLIDFIRNKSEEERTTYIKYTRERLIKGLKAFDDYGRLGFELALLKFLVSFPSENTVDQLMEVMSMHVYGSTPSCKTEIFSVKSAFVAIPSVLCKSDIIKQFDENNLKKIISALKPLIASVKWGPPSLEALTAIATKVSRNILAESMDEIIQQVSTSIDSTDDDLIGDEMLFILKCSNKLKKTFSRLQIPPIDLTTKKFLNKITLGMTRSSEAVAISLLDICLVHGVLKRVWLRLSATLTPENTSARNHFRFVQLLCHSMQNYDQNSISEIVTSESMSMLSSHLSKADQKYFSQCCTLMNNVLDSAIKRKPSGESLDAQNEKSRLDPNFLLSLLANFAPLIDFSCHSNAPKPCQMLLEKVPGSLNLSSVDLYAEHLMASFLECETETVGKTSVQNPDMIRCFVANQLKSVIHYLYKFKLEDSTELMNKIISFLFKAATASVFTSQTVALKVPLSAKSSKSCWSVLFRLLENLLNQTRTPHKQNKDTPAVSFEVLLAQMLQILLNSGIKMINESGNVENSFSFGDQLVHCVNAYLKLLRKGHQENPLDKCLINLLGVSCVYAFSSPSEDLSILLNDLLECRKRSLSNVTEGLPWPAVLTDAILSLLSQQNHMLRLATRFTFQQMITSGVLEQVSGLDNPNTDCVKLIRDLITTRATSQVKTKTENSGMEVDDDEDLVMFDSSKLGNHVTKKVVEQDSDEEDEDEESDSEDQEGEDSQSKSEQEDNDSGDDNDVQNDDDDDDDDDEEDGDDENMDENELELIREKVRKALGSAALEDEGAPMLNDEEMFAHDEALAEAFRSSRIQAPQRQAAEQARSLGELKMRCLDLLECLVQYSSHPNMLLSTLKLLLELGKASSKCNAKKFDGKKGGQKDRKNASFIARYGDLPPVERIFDVVNKLHGRSANVQYKFTDSLVGSDLYSMLVELVQLCIQEAQCSHPPQPFAKLVAAILHFIFKSVAAIKQNAPELPNALSEPIVELIRKFVQNARQFPIDPVMFMSIFEQYTPITESITPILLDTTAQFCQKCIESLDQTKVQITNAEWYTQAQFYGLLNRVYHCLTNEYQRTQMNPLAHSLCTHLIGLLRQTLVTIGKSSPIDTTSSWLNNTYLCETIFGLLMQLMKLYKQNINMLQEEDLLQSLTSLNNVPKSVRKMIRRFSVFVTGESRKEGKLIVPEDREAKLALKQQLKNERRQKRKEKALLADQRKNQRQQQQQGKSDKVITGNASTKKKPANAGSERSKSATAVGLAAPPKAKNIKKMKQKKRKSNDNNKVDKLSNQAKKIKLAS